MRYQKSWKNVKMNTFDDLQKENEYLRLLNSFYDRDEAAYNEFVAGMNMRK